MTMPAGPGRDTILASPAWPDIAAVMGRPDAAGIDIARISRSGDPTAQSGGEADSHVNRALHSDGAPSPASAANSEVSFRSRR
ncbi:hypothetical protein [Streptomyces erythrochromogenes]|uniref:hypothetical protein n=1 Tax=Streptomyces erythrochromogenes TaxID=285574 RepID=UPI00386C339C|nr:hypothetical protein OG489_37725 [Streptomyces erythrochromogenes]